MFGCCGMAFREVNLKLLLEQNARFGGGWGDSDGNRSGLGSWKPMSLRPDMGHPLGGGLIGV